MESASSDLQQHQLLLGSDPSKLPQLLNPVDLDQSISKYLAANGTDGEPPSVDQASNNDRFERVQIMAHEKLVITRH